MDKSQNTNISGERALKLLREMAVASTLFCLNHINAKQEHTQKAGMGRKDDTLLQEMVDEYYNFRG